jgi:hypothetical protein
MTYTATELAECAAREVKQRRRVYPRLIDQGKMTQSMADRQIAMMEEIARDYASKAEGEGLFAEVRSQ